MANRKQKPSPHFNPKQAGHEAFADDLLNDPKERAEHIMLVDLARNDVGRVSDYGTVKVTELMIVEHYSHVMHLPGIDHEKFTFRFQGRQFRLTDAHGNVVKSVLA